MSKPDCDKQKLVTSPGYTVAKHPNRISTDYDKIGKEIREKLANREKRPPR